MAGRLVAGCCGGMLAFCIKNSLKEFTHTCMYSNAVHYALPSRFSGCFQFESVHLRCPLMSDVGCVPASPKALPRAGISLCTPMACPCPSPEWLCCHCFPPSTHPRPQPTPTMDSGPHPQPISALMMTDTLQVAVYHQHERNRWRWLCLAIVRVRVCGQ